MNEMMEMALGFEGKKLPIKHIPVGCCVCRCRCLLIIQRHGATHALLNSTQPWFAADWVQGPEGVRGRNSENSLILSQLGWEPTVKLQDGLRLTYQWIKQQVCKLLPASFFPRHCFFAHLTSCNLHT